MLKNKSNIPFQNKANICGLAPYYLLLTVFIACLIIAQFLATKLSAIDVPFFGHLVFPCGVIAYALTFLCTDVISEVWGRRRAAMTVFCGLIANLVILLLIRIAMLLPEEPSWVMTQPFTQIAGMITRVTIASIAAYLLSQYHDVWFFHLMRRLTNARFLWLRNILSTSLSQFIDTVVFIFIAFYGTMDIKVIFSLIIGQFTVKVILAMLDTPFIYLLVWGIGRRENSR